MSEGKIGKLEDIIGTIKDEIQKEKRILKDEKDISESQDDFKFRVMTSQTMQLECPKEGRDGGQKNI